LKKLDIREIAERVRGELKGKDLDEIARRVEKESNEEARKGLQRSNIRIRLTKSLIGSSTPQGVREVAD
jgi:capsid protein